MAKALVTGSFDPVTRGHFSLFAKAARAFDEVVVCIFRNPNKSYFFSEEERLNFIRVGLCEMGLENVTADISDGYVADYAKEKGIGFIVRGVRSIDDMTYELEMARYNTARNPDVETFLWAAPKTESETSSSAVKAALKEGHIPEELLLPSVANEIRKLL